MACSKFEPPWEWGKKPQHPGNLRKSLDKTNPISCDKPKCRAMTHVHRTIAQILLGLEEEAKAELGKAVENLDEAEARDPSSSIIKFKVLRLVIATLGQKLAAGADDIWSEQLTGNEEKSVWLNIQGKFLRKIEACEEAQDAYNGSLQEVPDNPSGLMGLGKTLVNLHFSEDPFQRPSMKPVAVFDKCYRITREPRAALMLARCKMGILRFETRNGRLRYVRRNEVIFSDV